MKTRPQILVCLFGMLSAGCVITATSGDDARNARLPIGVTLLDADRGLCAGAVAIDDDSIATAQTSDLVIQRGQNATFRVDAYDDEDVDVDWTCVGSASAVDGSAECPDDTSHVRITRDLTGSEFLLECYGDRD
ncbi:MAG TPA: hypothetical protein VKA43_06805 [Gammaproteobacteria bacterium]|nr:hypothetical protein [Gammaproteobacteria bacterium]